MSANSSVLPHHILDFSSDCTLMKHHWGASASGKSSETPPEQCQRRGIWGKPSALNACSMSSHTGEIWNLFGGSSLWPHTPYPSPPSAGVELKWSERGWEGKKQETLRRRSGFPSGHACICIRTPSVAIKTNTISWIYFMGRTRHSHSAHTCWAANGSYFASPFLSCVSLCFNPHLSHLPCLIYPSYTNKEANVTLSITWECILWYVVLVWLVFGLQISHYHSDHFPL